MSFEAAVHAKAVQLDHLTLDMCAAAGSGHPTSCMSLGHSSALLGRGPMARNHAVARQNGRNRVGCG
jgi:transketolase